MECVFTDRAQRDLEEIADYIALDSPERAVDFIRKIRQRCQSITLAPEGYPLCPDYGTDIRKVAYKNYLLFYTLTEGRLVIVHITHGSRFY